MNILDESLVVITPVEAPEIEYQACIYPFDELRITSVEDDDIPESFFTGLQECECGHVVDMETALQHPPKKL